MPIRHKIQCNDIKDWQRIMLPIYIGNIILCELAVVVKLFDLKLTS